MTTPRLRTADARDAGSVARLHADSWRRNYRGAYSNAFLDGDLVADRLAVWSARLGTPGNTLTVLAEDETGLVGFVHVVFDKDAHWGSLVDNLHVVHGRQRGGVGTALLARAASAVNLRATHRSVYLWVLEQNTAAQRFYAARGGTRVERRPVAAISMAPERLDGDPHGYRIAWPDADALARAAGG